MHLYIPLLARVDGEGNVVLIWGDASEIPTKTPQQPVALTGRRENFFYTKAYLYIVLILKISPYYLKMKFKVLE